MDFRLPNAFFEEDGAVYLNGNAPTGGALVEITSSDPNAVTAQTPVIISEGHTSNTIQLTFLPTSRAENVTLTARYRNTSLEQAVAIHPWLPLSIRAGSNTLQKGETTTVTVDINPIAPSQGTTVSISSSDPSAISVPAMPVPIRGGGYETTFTIKNNYSGTPKRVTIFGYHRQRNIGVSRGICAQATLSGTRLSKGLALQFRQLRV